MNHPEPARSATVRALFGGDVMLGRLVAERILADGAIYPLAPVAALMRDADLTVVNLECAITQSAHRWAGEPKAFYFGAPPQAIDTLTHAGVDMVSLANNHILDFDLAGLRDTLHLLREAGICMAGAGMNWKEASAPAIVERQGIHFGMAAFCDHQPDFAATADRPGMAWLDLADEASARQAFRRALESILQAGAVWPILSLHWGPNMVVRPSTAFRRLAHAAIDMGWRMIFGHSAHVFQGIELYQGCPILYAAGDLVDDYWVDPEFRNDHQLLYELELDRERVRQIILHPVFIDACQVRPASGPEFDDIAAQMTRLCNELGTMVRMDAECLRIKNE